MKAGADRGPIRIVVVIEIGDERGIGFLFLTHPDPDIAMALERRIGTHADARRHAILTGDPHASALRIEGEAVIAALDRVTDDLAFGERRAAVAAAILERDRRSVFAAIKQHRLF